MSYFNNKGLMIGIISDTSPSLQISLEQLGLGELIDSYTCSDIAGAMKPYPLIYQTALNTLGVEADDCIYVDDYDIEADGARNLGFTAFHIDRSNTCEGEWVIRSFEDVV